MTSRRFTKFDMPRDVLVTVAKKHTEHFGNMVAQIARMLGLRVIV